MSNRNKEWTSWEVNIDGELIKCFNGEMLEEEYDDNISMSEQKSKEKEYMKIFRMFNTYNNL